VFDSTGILDLLPLVAVHHGAVEKRAAQRRPPLVSLQVRGVVGSPHLPESQAQHPLDPQIIGVNEVMNMEGEIIVMKYLNRCVENLKSLF
jgi:hypothetical protein